MFLDFVYTAVSWVLLRWHQLFSALGMNPADGLTWTLSIVFLVITTRLALFRLFIRQLHYTRNMQKIQPEIAKLRAKYKNDRAELNRQMIKLQQVEGFNPLSGCLPMFLQVPIFLGLYHVLRHLSAAASPSYQLNHPDRLTLYTFTKHDTLSAAHAKLFGKVPLAASFHDSTHTIVNVLGGQVGSTRLVIAIVLLISAAATLCTQLLVRVNATTVPADTTAKVQRLMMYVIPLGVLASGLLFNFPLGVLLYWFTSNIWTLAQQGYVIRHHPPTDRPGAPEDHPPDRPRGGGGQRPTSTQPGATHRPRQHRHASREPDDTGRPERRMKQSPIGYPPAQPWRVHPC
ncbi:MAG TPA: membrane protein insertase YidC [Jatrophihabitantaceae bacterium]|jgi:YidC/Oxa1 family membrane protein insertase